MGFIGSITGGGEGAHSMVFGGCGGPGGSPSGAFSEVGGDCGGWQESWAADGARTGG